MTGNSSLPSLIPSRSSTGAISQQSTLVGGCSQSSRTSTGVVSQQSISPGTAPASNALRAAVSKFRARLSGQQLLEFKNTTYEQLCHEVLRIQYEQENNKNMMNLSRIQSCLEAMHQFGKVIEVFLNMSNAVAFVWGPIKFLLLTASNFADTFETLLDAYEQIGEQLPLLQEYESLFFSSPHMLQALELMYIDILEFHQQAIRFFSGKLWHRLFRSMWKDFGTKFGGILKSLRRHKDLVECRATLSQYQRYREDISELKTKLDDVIAQEQSKKMKAVKEWLAVGSQPQQEDHDRFRNVRGEFPSTGRWILEHEILREWLDTDLSATPLLWITGVPGAGKTILASNIIDECKRRTGYITSYFYCHYEDQDANTAVGVLRGLMDQLLDQYPQLLPHCHTKYAASGEPSLRSFPVAKRLFEDFCSTIPELFIVVDGLDECEQVDRKQLVECLVEVTNQAEIDEPGKLRVVFVSQDYADIRRALHSSSTARVIPKTVALSSKDNEGDILIYVSGWVDRITNQFAPFTEELTIYLRNLTVARAKGMFLYAKLVMDNLYNQPTRGDLLEAIRLENFPDGLKEAYGRILKRIKKVSEPHPEEWKKATKLLGWMVCCKRQLTWKEIQVALSIDIENKTIDYDDRRLRKHIHDICGSLVQVTGDRVALVHSTAKHYLTKCTEDIHPPSVECELAALCLQYLTYPCFAVDEVTSKDTLHHWMMSGHFAFQDYAIAKWSHHINAFVNTGQDLLNTGSNVQNQLCEMSHAIDEFIAEYDEEGNMHHTNVAECKIKCEVFAAQDFYDDLVALTSHIYTFQKKGFDARHKISIKKLQTALERNRKLLEELPIRMKGPELEEFTKFYDPERRYKCTRITCMYFSEGFKDKKSRTRHVNIHDRPYQCEVPDCLGNEGFANSKDLEKHTRSFHPEISDLAERFNSITANKAKTTHTCEICGKSFTRKLIKEDHVRSHRGERPHECSECGKAFTRKNDWKRHMKVHERP